MNRKPGHSKGLRRGSKSFREGRTFQERGPARRKGRNTRGRKEIFQQKTGRGIGSGSQSRIRLGPAGGKKRVRKRPRGVVMGENSEKKKGGSY